MDGLTYYPCRCARFALKQGSLVAYHPAKPRVFSFDDWPKLVFLEADGERSVGELIEYFAGGYDGAPPPNLSAIVVEQCARLEAEGLVRMQYEPCPPAAEHAAPMSDS